MVWQQLVQLPTPKEYSSVKVNSCKGMITTRWWCTPRGLRGWPGPWREVHTWTRWRCYYTHS